MVKRKLFTIEDYFPYARLENGHYYIDENNETFYLCEDKDYIISSIYFVDNKVVKATYQIVTSRCDPLYENDDLERVLKLYYKYERNFIQLT